MKEFIRNNMTLVAGISLPLILIVFLTLAATLPKLLVSSPTYSLIYATDYNDSDAARIKYDVVGGKLVEQRNECLRERCHTPKAPKLYIFNSKTLTASNVSYDFVKDYTISDSTTSPDGYEYERYKRNYGLVRMFAGRSDRSSFIVKSGNRIKVPYTENYYRVKFLGWIIQK